MWTVLLKLLIICCCRQLPVIAHSTTLVRHFTTTHQETIASITAISPTSLEISGQHKNYSLKFISCIKWRLFSPREFILTEPNILVYKAGNVNISFEPSDYKLVKNNTAYTCIPNSLRSEWAFVDYIYWSTRITSVFFLVLSIAIHVWLLLDIPEKNTRAILCHKISLLMFYGSMWVYLRRCSDFIFELNTIISAYGVTAAYCWINVISYDMWRSFHPKRMFRHTPTTLRSFRHFVRQSVYAWGLPVVILALSFAFSLLPLAPLTSWKRAGPIYGNIVQISFMITCLSIIVLTNGVFCVLTIYNIRHTRQNHILLTSRSEASSAIFRVYVKLILVSGFLYLLDIGEWVHLHADFFGISWLIPDWLSSAQGLWLFLVYCCNASVLGAIKRKFKECRQ